MIAETFHEHIPDAQALAVAVPPPPGTLTPEQIDERHNLVELHRLTSEGAEYRPSFELVRELSLLTPEEAEVVLERERSSPYRSGLLEQYHAYVEDLKAVRERQGEHLKESFGAVTQEQDPEARRQKFLEALAFSPELARQTLQYINDRSEKNADMSLQTSRLFSDKQIEAASRDSQLFQQAIVQAVTREPQIVVQSHDVLRLVATDEQLKGAFNTLRDSHPHALLRKEYLANALTHYREEEKAAYVNEVFERNLDSGAPALHLIDTLADPAIIELIGRDRAMEIAEKYLEAQDSPPLTYSAKTAIAAGLLTLDQLRKKVMDTVRETPSDYLAAQYYQGEILTGEEKAEMHEAVIGGIREQGPRGLYGMENSDVLSEADRRQLVQEMFESEPDQVIEHAGAAALKYLEEEVIITHFRQRLGEQDNEILSYSGRMLFLKSMEVSPEEKRQYLDRLLVHSPGDFLQAVSSSIWGHSNILREIYSEAEIPDKIRTATINSQYVSLSTVIESMPYFGDKQQQKEFLRWHLENTGNSIEDILALMRDDPDGDQEGLYKFFTREELEEELAHAIERVAKGALFFGDAMTFQKLAVELGEEHCRDVLDSLLAERPKIFMDVIGGVAYLYSNEELNLVVERLTADPDNIRDLMMAIASRGSGNCWANYADKETIKNLVVNNAGGYSEYILYASNELKRFLPHEDMALLAQRLVEVNPAAAISVKGLEFVSEHIKGISEESIIEAALTDQSRMSVAGKYLSDILKNIQKTEGETARQRLINDAINLYQSLDLVISSNYLSTLQTLHEKIGPNATVERQLLDGFTALISLGGVRLQEVGQVQSLEALEAMIIQEAGHILGIDRPISSEQVSKLNEALGSITNLATYLSQYKKSQPHLGVIAPLLESLLEGGYEAWKYGDGSEESMRIMQDSGLLPPNLTPEQYRTWRLDTESRHESINVVHAEAVTHEFKRILNENHILLPEGSIVPEDEYQTVIEGNALVLASYGQRIATIHGELKVLRNEPSQEMAAQQIGDLETELYDLQSKFKTLQLRQDAITVFHLTLDDIGRGRIGGEKKGQNISNILQRIRKNLDGDAAFLIEQLGGVYESYQEQTGKPQTVTVTDTGNPKITIEIGAVPVGSCQHFRSGSVNRALLGYTDPNHKIMVVRNERGNLVARSISRLLANDNGDPVLHVETVYSVDASDDVVKAVYTHAIQKGVEMGVPVTISPVSQNDEGQSVAARNVEGIKQDPFRHPYIYSAGSRAPFVYVDSAGGAKANGLYSIHNLSQIGQST